jgi:Zinc carboxypeptidase
VFQCWGIGVGLLVSAGVGLTAAPARVAASATSAEGVALATAGDARFIPIEPTRVADTRGRTGFVRLTPSTIRVALAGVAAIPANATSVILTVTATNTTAPGFVTVWPGGQPRPTASNLNITAAGQTLAATVASPLGSGAVDVAVDSSADLIIDVSGAFVPVTGAVADGRFVPLAPSRLLDTRSSPRSVAAGRSVTVGLPPNVPADATALALNLTFTDTKAAGYFTVWPAGRIRPPTSSGNSDGPGQTRALFAVVPVSATGVSIFTQSGAHVVVDVTGYFTGASAPPSIDGLFRSATPTRVLDSRADERVWPGQRIEVATPSGTQAVWANVTTVGALAPSYVTVFAAGTALPPVSTVNATEADDVVANATITPVSTRGIGVFSSAGEHVLVDVAGSFTGSPLAATESVVKNTMPADVVVRDEIGVSVGGRPIAAYRMRGSPAPTRKVLVIGEMHGEEPAGLAVSDALIAGVKNTPDNLELWVVPTMNPDGASTGMRGNGRGVDLNRNFDGGAKPWCPAPGCGEGADARNTGTGPLSEPESKAIWAFVNRVRPDVIVIYHQPLDEVDCSPNRGQRLLALCTAYATAAGLTVNRVGYIDVSGTLTNSYMQANPGRWAFTVEYGSGPPKRSELVGAVLAIYETLYP